MRRMGVTLRGCQRAFRGLAGGDATRRPADPSPSGCTDEGLRRRARGPESVVHKDWAYWPADATGRFHLAPADRGASPRNPRHPPPRGRPTPMADPRHPPGMASGRPELRQGGRDTLHPTLTPRTVRSRSRPVRGQWGHCMMVPRGGDKFFFVNPHKGLRLGLPRPSGEGRWGEGTCPGHLLGGSPTPHADPSPQGEETFRPARVALDPRRRGDDGRWVGAGGERSWQPGQFTDRRAGEQCPSLLPTPP